MLRFAHGLSGGSYRVVVTGKRSGCSVRGSSSTTWRFAKTALPVVAARTSAYAESYATSMPVVLRSVGGRSVRGVTASLVSAKGKTIASATKAGTFRSSTVLNIPLKAPLSAGDYRLRVTGKVDGEATTLSRTQPLVLGSSADANLPPARRRP